MTILRERFLNDVKDLETKMNHYFNQNENYKRSLSPRKEKKSLDRILESHFNNCISLAHVSSLVRLL